MNITPLTEPILLQEALERISNVTLFEVVDATTADKVLSIVQATPAWHHFNVEITANGITITGKFHKISLVSVGLNLEDKK